MRIFKTVKTTARSFFPF